MTAVPTAAASPTPAYRPAKDHRTDLDADWAQLDQLIAGMEERA